MYKVLRIITNPHKLYNNVCHYMQEVWYFCQNERKYKILNKLYIDYGNTLCVD